MPQPHLKVENLSCAYAGQPVFEQVSLALQKGEIGALLGSSGCGKSTLLRAIAGFEPIQSGTIQLEGLTLADQTQITPAHQRKIGMVFQDHALFPHLNVTRNIGFGLREGSRSEKKQRIEELLQMIALTDKASAMPHQLSGGQQQRVALARALAPEPELLLMDEPFASLDRSLRTRLAEQIKTWLKQTKTTTLVVTHNAEEATAMADSTGTLEAGRLSFQLKMST